jgi:hypothetical protein
MSEIDPWSVLLGHIRSQALTWGRQRSAPGASPAADQGRRVGPTAGPVDWPAQIVSAVRQISPDDPERPRKAFRVFLRAAIARDLGFTQLDAPGFLGLVDRVQETMEADERLEEAIGKASALLMERAK